MKIIRLLYVIGCIGFGSVLCADEDQEAQERLETKMELFEIEKSAALLECPLSFSDAFAKLGGAKVLKWSYNSDLSEQGKTHSERVFIIVSGRLKDKGYCVVFDGVNLEKADDKVDSVRVGYMLPLGGIYFADPIRIRAVLGKDKHKANQSLQPTTMSVTAAANAPAAPATVVADL